MVAFSHRNWFDALAAGPDDPQVASTFLGYLTLTRGIGNVFSTPISSVLQPSSSSSSGSNSGSKSFASLINETDIVTPFFASSDVNLQLPAAASTGFSVSDHRFQNLIIYVGTCFAAAAVVMLIGWGWEKWYLRSMKNEGSRERVRVRE
jgi:MFS transporter, MCT family, solute carrier family 16 (monocarboxylic acid transporters), member 10